MNVLHVTPYLAPAWAYGDVARVVSELARAQAAQGHSVTVLATDALAPHERLAAGETIVDGVRVRRVRNVSGAVRTWLNLSTPVGMRRLARAVFSGQAVDVVHLHELRTVENVRVAGVVPAYAPIVVSPHGTLGYDTGRSWAKRGWDLMVGHRLLERVDRFVALSSVEVQEIHALYGARGRRLAPERVAVVPNGVDLSRFAALPDRREALRRFGLGSGPVVLFFGRLSDREGIGLLIAAFAEAKRHVPDAQLLVAGPDHGALAALRTQVLALDVGAAVRFPGYLTGEDTLSAFAAADVFALPATGEGHRPAALESLASGVPVLLGSGCHRPEVAAGGAGREVPLNEAAWADALRGLLQGPGERLAMRQRARAVAASFGWPSVASRTQRVYEQARSARTR